MKQELGLSRAGLDTAFPFHFAVDREGVVRQCGPSISRVCPGLVPGASADEMLRLVRPPLPFRAAELIRSAPEFVVIEAPESSFVLRGQTLTEGDVLLFLGSPWLTAPHQLEEHQLRFGDFALHDPVVDYLSLLDTKNAALADASRFAQALHQANARLSALITRLPYGVLTESEDGKVALTNESFCRMFGVDVPPEALVGADCVQAAEMSKTLFVDPEAFLDGIRQRLRDRQPTSGEVLELRDGRVFERHYVPIFDGQQHRGNLWQYRDVTDLRRAERELLAARERAEDANDAKSRFLAMMSHEMRTPLGVIVGLSELLSERISEPDRENYLARLRTNASALLGLIDDVLDFSRLEAGSVELHNGPFEPCRLAEDVTSSMAIRAAQKGLSLSLDLQGAVDVPLVGAESRLRQVLLNLVNNAIKFTDAGGVLLRLCATARNRRTIRVRYEVVDTGRGIPPHLQERVFERFVRVEAEGAPLAEGTGLGLSICRALVERMGARIDLQSEPGHGSVFGFEVEHEIASAADAPSLRPVEGKAQKVRAGRILLAEDDPDNREVMLRMLTRAGYEVDTATNGAVAFERLRAFDYDLLVTDVQMPITDGLALTRSVRELEAAGSMSRTPILVVTAHAVDSFRERALALGVDAYLTKPIRGAALVDAVDHHIDQRPRVLLVDDSEDARAVTSRQLNAKGKVRVVTARDGETALLRVTRAVPELVLLDGTMAGMSGEDTARAIRALPLVRQPIIVALTGHGEGEALSRLMAAGCDHYLQKPVTGAQLEALMGKYFPSASVPSDSTSDAAEGASARVKFDADMLDLVPGYLRQRLVDVARIREMLASGADLATLTHLGHQLKGSGGAYGLPEVSVIGGLLEAGAAAGDRAAIAALADRLEAHGLDAQRQLQMLPPPDRGAA